MNFKEFEERISNINNQIFAFFMQIEEEENKQINDVFQSLKQNLDSQKNILVDFERQLKEDDDQYQSKIAALEKEILNIASEPETYLHILEEKKAFLSQKKNDEQKRILALQRRRRSEFAHRINTLNKELSLLLKEHNNQLEEEEKNYKAKETELMRRMNIDLQKANEKRSRRPAI